MKNIRLQSDFKESEMRCSIEIALQAPKIKIILNGCPIPGGLG
jgi:hypothetical protein